MIVLIIAGGLGNQLFEYAAAKAMALRSGTEVCLNTKTGFERDKVYKRVFCLDRFPISYKTNRFLSFDFPGGYIFNKISRMLGRHIFMPCYKYIFDTNVSIKDLKQNPQKYKNVVLQGTWVKYEYFEDYAQEIRLIYEVNTPYTEQMKYYLLEIERSPIPIVAMGVRVYQEIVNPELRKSEFYAQEDYYNRAIAYYKNKLGRFKLYIFTQAKEWVLSHVKLDGIEYEFVQTSTGDMDATNDMLIMSKCHHYIISNSSYYFWATFLNCKDKDVIIPKQWTSGVMKEWIKL